MTNTIRALCAIALVVLSAVALSRASAQAPQPPKLPVDPNCCYLEKPNCEATCPITDADPREVCLRDCEGRLRACLGAGVFAPKQGKEVVCLKRPGQPG